MSNNLKDHPTKSDPPLDPTFPTPEEEQQFVEQGKKQTEDLDPEANKIQAEFVHLLRKRLKELRFKQHSMSGLLLLQKTI